MKTYEIAEDKSEEDQFENIAPNHIDMEEPVGRVTENFKPLGAKLKRPK